MTFCFLRASFFFFCLATALFQLLGNVALISAFRVGGFGESIVFHKLEVILTAMIGALLFAELPSHKAVAGIVLSGIGVIVMNLTRDGGKKHISQIFALGRASPTRSCGTVRVDETAYYSIFDTELSESCDDQRDETGYLTVTNRCNTDGWATERNAGDRFLVPDSDNSPDCLVDSDCGPGRNFVDSAGCQDDPVCL